MEGVNKKKKKNVLKIIFTRELYKIIYLEMASFLEDMSAFLSNHSDVRV